MLWYYFAEDLKETDKMYGLISTFDSINYNFACNCSCLCTVANITTAFL